MKKRRGKRGGSKGKPSIHDLSKRPITYADFPAIEDELTRSSDRACAVMACEMVNTALIMALTTRFVPTPPDELEALFFGQNSFLSSFAARIKVARAIGIVGLNVVDMLDTFRRVRNAFAHCVAPLSFKEPVIVEECNHLPDWKLGDGVAPPDMDPTRERYVAACMAVMIGLALVADRHSDRPQTLKVDMRDEPDPNPPSPGRYFE